MTESTNTPKVSAVVAEQTAESERRLARNFALGIPAATLAATAATAAFTSTGPALLVLAGGGLVFAVACFFASVRTLAGDAPLPEDMEELAFGIHGIDRSAERKKMLLRSLKDLENEHALGKIDDADYKEVAARYRDEIKSLMREMDDSIEPLREKAEELVRAHLLKVGLGPESSEVAAAPGAEEPARVACPKCVAANEPDAKFCKSCGAAISAATKAPEGAPKETSPEKPKEKPKEKAEEKPADKPEEKNDVA